MLGAVAGFDWDAGNRDKCQKHGLTLEEVESVVAHNETLIVPDVEHSLIEHRLIAVGRVPSGRYALVVFTLRQKGGMALVRPISARPMHAKEVRRYEKEISHSQDRRRS
jgi:uncharacterized DUF497 family protein